MSDILCVTNRKLCEEDFLARICKIASAHPAGIVLREKDLSENEYKKLAAAVLAICQKHGTPCILHNFADIAAELNCNALHLPLPVLRGLSDKKKARFTVLGASCHSVEDAVEAQRIGCTYITAGHIFDTDCKRGLPGHGLGFLEMVCRSVSIPVYAIGGIRAADTLKIRQAGAAGACVMSGAMVCDNVQKYISGFKET